MQNSRVWKRNFGCCYVDYFFNGREGSQLQMLLEYGLILERKKKQKNKGRKESNNNT